MSPQRYRVTLRRIQRGAFYVGADNPEEAKLLATTLLDAVRKVGGNHTAVLQSLGLGLWFDDAVLVESAEEDDE